MNSPSVCHAHLFDYHPSCLTLRLGSTALQKADRQSLLGIHGTSSLSVALKIASSVDLVEAG